MSERVSSPNEFSQLVDNFVYGCAPSRMTQSSIIFEGKGNILFIEEGVSLRKSRIVFQGDNGVAYLSSSKHALNLSLSIFNDSTFYIGGNSYTNPAKPLNAVASERKYIVIGEDSLCSFGVWIRTADPHLIFRNDDLKRINPSKGVVVGDHVWIGQEAMLLKGTVVGSGSIVAARSVCSNKAIPSNTSWGGNPAKQIGEGICFSKQSAHTFSREQTERHMTFSKRDYIYIPSTTGESVLQALDVSLSGDLAPSERVEFLKTLSLPTHEHDRFAIVDSKGTKRRRSFFSR